jgi:hypothetical protein
MLIATLRQGEPAPMSSLVRKSIVPRNILLPMERPGRLDNFRKTGRGLRTASDLQAQIDREFYTLLERLGAEPELLAVVRSWRDNLDDADILAMLQEYNSRNDVHDLGPSIVTSWRSPSSPAATSTSFPRTSERRPE